MICSCEEVVDILFADIYLRVLGSPNPGQLFGRGLSGPQATEVSRDPRGSWAATNLTVHSSNSFSGPPFCRPALGFYSWVAFFDVCRFFRVFKPEEGTWISVVSWRTQLCTLPLCRKKIDVCFFERLENSEKVREFWSSLGGPHSATNWQRALGFYSWNAFLDVFCFFVFSNLRRVRGFQNIFRHQPSPAEAR